MTEWYIGQKVFSLLYGKGVIEKISEHASHPLIVLAENGMKTSYKLDGFYSVKSQRLLYPVESKVEITLIKEVYEWVAHISDKESSTRIFCGSISKFKTKEEALRYFRILYPSLSYDILNLLPLPSTKTEGSEIIVLHNGIE